MTQSILRRTKGKYVESRATVFLVPARPCRSTEVASAVTRGGRGLAARYPRQNPPARTPRPPRNRRSGPPRGAARPSTSQRWSSPTRRAPAAGAAGSRGGTMSVNGLRTPPTPLSRPACDYPSLVGGVRLKGGARACAEGARRRYERLAQTSSNSNLTCSQRHECEETLFTAGELEREGGLGVDPYVEDGAERDATRRLRPRDLESACARARARHGRVSAAGDVCGRSKKIAGDVREIAGGVRESAREACARCASDRLRPGRGWGRQRAAAARSRARRGVGKRGGGGTRRRATTNPSSRGSRTSAPRRSAAGGRRRARWRSARRRRRRQRRCRREICPPTS